MRTGQPGFAVRGVVNLISAFPQLASAILIDRYAFSPSVELEIRGWPREVGEAARRVNESLDWALLEGILSSASRGLLSDSYAYTLYHDAATGAVKPSILYNYLSLLFDIGGELYRFVWCVEASLARAAAGLVGGSLEELRRVDALFIHVLQGPVDEDEPEEAELEYYACTPSWASRALGLLEKLATAAPGIGDPAPTLSRLRSLDPATYLLLRMAAYIPLNRAFTCLRVLLGGSWGFSRVEGLLEPVGAMAVFNYSARPRLRVAIETVESGEVVMRGSRWRPDLGAAVDDSGVLTTSWEGVATLLCGGFEGELRVVGDPPFEPSALNGLGAVVERSGSDYRVMAHGGGEERPRGD